MSRAFITEVIRQSAEVTGTTANRAMRELISAITDEIVDTGGFSMPGFGVFTIRDVPKRKAINPKTGEKIVVEARRTVKFRASPVLKRAVGG
jgi:DNA-binding protein HU-beta